MRQIPILNWNFPLGLCCPASQPFRDLWSKWQARLHGLRGHGQEYSLLDKEGKFQIVMTSLAKVRGNDSIVVYSTTTGVFRLNSPKGSLTRFVDPLDFAQMVSITKCV